MRVRPQLRFDEVPGVGELGGAVGRRDEQAADLPRVAAAEVAGLMQASTAATKPSTAASAAAFSSGSSARR